LVVGAHYGLRDWLSQRVTAVVMAAYTIILLAAFFGARNFSYEGWAGLFAGQWMKMATFVTILCLVWHAWVGMRDIWMDYIKPPGIRFGLQVLTIVWLVGCLGYAVQSLWRV
jgi:succinate dehydrogenase / fumarate reductase membrane anchor subunit